MNQGHLGLDSVLKGEREGGEGLAQVEVLQWVLKEPIIVYVSKVSLNVCFISHRE